MKSEIEIFNYVWENFKINIIEQYTCGLHYKYTKS